MKKNYWLLLALSVSIFACTKNNNGPAQTTTPMLKVVSTSNVPNTVSFIQEYSYDDLLRVKEIKEGGGNNPVLRKRYTYANNKILLRVFDNNGAEQNYAAVDYFLNAAGMVEEYYSSNYGFRNLYEYNEQGFIKRVQYFRNGQPDGYQIYHYSGNNLLDSISNYENNNTKAYVSIFTYLMNQRNTTGTLNSGMQMFGKSQVFALKNETRIVYNLPGGMNQRLKYFEDDYGHTYDGQHRINETTIIRTYYTYPGAVKTTNLLAIKGFTYQ